MREEIQRKNVFTGHKELPSDVTQEEILETVERRVKSVVPEGTSPEVMQSIAGRYLRASARMTDAQEDEILQKAVAAEEQQRGLQNNLYVRNPEGGIEKQVGDIAEGVQEVTDIREAA